MLTGYTKKTHHRSSKSEKILQLICNGRPKKNKIWKNVPLRPFPLIDTLKIQNLIFSPNFFMSLKVRYVLNLLCIVSQVRWPEMDLRCSQKTYILNFPIILSFFTKIFILNSKHNIFTYFLYQVDPLGML